MSVSMTADAVIERRKTVTRRKGWRFLRPGDRLTLCRKVQGRKPGEPLVRLAEVEVVSVAREPLWELTRRDYATTYPPAPTAYASREVAREGFPAWSATPTTFVGDTPGEVCEDLLRAAGSFGAGVLDLDTRETVRVTHSGQEAQR